jgi:hypothetical protein
VTKTEYRDYLCSEHWKMTRKSAIEASEGKCERCAMPRWLAEIVYDQDLHVHHKTYLNLGAEELEDLEVLCRRCHDIESNGRSDLPKIKPQACRMCHGPRWDKRSDTCAFCAELIAGPALFHLCGVLNPLSGTVMWKSFMGDIALFCFYEDEGEALIEFIRKAVFDAKASMAEGLPF